jgi:hypothetical protein
MSKQRTTTDRMIDKTAATAQAGPPDPMPLINELSPTPLKREEVAIRSMILCTDRVCESDGMRFSHGALADVARKVIGVSVLTGHDRRNLPVARFFRAELTSLPEINQTTGQETQAVRAWFYWLAETSGSEDLRLNIDGGIYRAVSISWRYSADRCSVCGSTSKSCPHTPGKTYDGVLCHRVIDAVDEVLEGSLVYKGADSQALLAMEHRRASDGAESTTTCRQPLHFDRQWIEMCASILHPLPRRAMRCLVLGVLASETGEILHNLGWCVRYKSDGASFDAVWLNHDASSPFNLADIVSQLPSHGLLIATGAGGRAPLDNITTGMALVRVESFKLWLQPWWMMELEVAS